MTTSQQQGGRQSRGPDQLPEVPLIKESTSDRVTRRNFAMGCLGMSLLAVAGVSTAVVWKGCNAARDAVGGYMKDRERSRSRAERESMLADEAGEKKQREQSLSKYRESTKTLMNSLDDREKQQLAVKLINKMSAGDDISDRIGFVDSLVKANKEGVFKDIKFMQELSPALDEIPKKQWSGYITGLSQRMGSGGTIKKPKDMVPDAKIYAQMMKAE